MHLSPQHAFIVPVKSAYELAMERLSKSSPSRKLNEEQKSRIAEIESISKARLAQAELAFQERLKAFLESGDFEKAETARAEYQAERAKIESDREGKKARVRDE